MQPASRLIVKWRAGVRTDTVSVGNKLSVLRAKTGIALRSERAFQGKGHLVSLSRPLPLAEAQALARLIAQDPAVEYAEPDIRLHPVRTLPNDPLYASEQWHYHSVAAPDNEVGGVNLPEAWDISTGDAGIVIAVIDTGLVAHADLDDNINDASGRVVAGYDFIDEEAPGSYLIANDGDGRDADPSDPGDWITRSESRGSTDGGFFYGCDEDDSSWHGTHVAGTIGALSDNGVGVAGVNWNARLQPIRVLGKCGGYLSDIADAIRWAAGLSVSGVPVNATPAKVLNLSLGGFGACPASMQSAIDAAVGAGAVVVVAAGNQGGDVSNFTPANCRNVIAVGATNSAGDYTGFSNFGSAVTLAAPGSSVYSTINRGTTSPIASPSGDTYASYRGTSMATPHVSGIAGLMLAAAPTLTPAEVLQKLQRSVRPYAVGSSCTPSTCGAGVINAYAAVRCTQSGTAPTVNAGNDQTVSPGSVIKLSAYMSDDCAASFAWQQTNGPTFSAMSGGSTGTPSITVPRAAGTLTFRVTAWDDEGQSATDTVSLTIANVAPQLDNIGNKTINPGGALAFTVSATDANGTTPTLSATNVPSGASFDAATGAFQWSSAGPEGTYQVTFRATDSANASDANTVTIRVQNSSSGGGGCFIATAAYGTPMASDVRYLRAFRDEYLLTSPLGRTFVALYYRYSPPFAEWLRERDGLRAAVRALLTPLVWMSRWLVDDTAVQQQTADRP